jgi:hypothetical protein
LTDSFEIFPFCYYYKTQLRFSNAELEFVARWKRIWIEVNLDQSHTIWWVPLYQNWILFFLRDQLDHLRLLLTWSVFKLSKVNRFDAAWVALGFWTTFAWVCTVNSRPWIKSETLKAVINAHRCDLRY